jgi:excisionase family DNA binding protein
MEDLCIHLQEFCRSIAVEEFQRLRDNEVKKSVYSEKPLNVNEAAKYLSVAPSTLYRYANEGQIPHALLGKRIYFFEEDIIASLKEKRVKSKSEIASKVGEEFSGIKIGQR